MQGKKWLAAGCILLAALTLRLCDFPTTQDFHHPDEGGYIAGSLQLLEGITPQYKYSPAGPQTWAGWFYGGAQAGKYFLLPTAEERSVSIQARPFYAVNHALFDNYRDMRDLRMLWVIVALPFVLWAVISGFNLGYNRAGLAGGVLGGGIVALLPVLGQLASEARPYAMAWSLGIIALDYALVRRERPRLTLAAVMFGLAVGSRIDMLLIAPLVWSELWARRRTDGFARPMLRFHLVAAMTSLLVAPWLLTNLIGNLRTIATVRFGPPPFETSFTSTLLEVVWGQGLWLILLLFVAGLFLRREGERWPRFLLGIYALLLLAFIFKATGFGLQHQGGQVVAILALCAGGLKWMEPKDEGKRMKDEEQPARSASSFILHPSSFGLRWIVVAVALLLPAVQAVRGVVVRRQAFVPDGSVEWIEKHVPPGTIVYSHLGLQSVLPTPSSADMFWHEVADETMWQRKFQAGLERFGLSVQQLPRALSEENVLVERGNRRGTFILGSRPHVEPRYDVRPIMFSQALGRPPVAEQLRNTGGVVLWREPVPSDNAEVNRQWELVNEHCGPPVAAWVGTTGRGASVFLSPELKASLGIGDGSEAQ